VPSATNISGKIAATMRSFRLAHWFHHFRRYRAFIWTPFRAVRSLNTSNAPLSDDNVLDLITVAFNNDALIEHQIGLLKQNLADPHHYTVIDNSNRAEMRAQIEALCAREGAAYVGLPANPYDGHPGLSHGAALNWAHRHYIAPRRARYWGSIDHDMYPIRRTTIIPHLQACGLYGVLHFNGDAWYLWPGFGFFARWRTQRVAMNFLPVPGLDTGGGNWQRLYSGNPKSTVPTPSFAYIDLRAGEGETAQAARAERHGDWLHMVNGSNWAAADGKLELFEALLRKCRDGVDNCHAGPAR
jgi:hypothetical protein